VHRKSYNGTTMILQVYMYTEYRRHNTDSVSEKFFLVPTYDLGVCFSFYIATKVLHRSYFKKSSMHVQRDQQFCFPKWKGRALLEKEISA
jgi:hypothetical protein